MKAWASEQLSEILWQAHTDSYIEPKSFLLRQDGSRMLDPVGADVAVIKQGYIEQCKALNVEECEPRWTSLRARSLQSLGAQRGSRLALRPRHLPLGPVEFCRVTDVSYHRCECLDNKAPEQQKKTSKGQYFVRLVLQSTSPAQRDTPLATIIDFHLSLDIPAFVLSRERFETAVKRRWRPKDRVQMFWELPDTDGLGHWWQGRVLGVVARPPGHPLWASPWETLNVEWEESPLGPAETCFVCSWEVERNQNKVRIQYLGESENDELSDADVFNPADDESNDEEYRGSGRQRRAGHRRRQGFQAHRTNSSGSDDDAFRPPRRRPLPDVPLTMQRSQSYKKDWSSYFCSACNDGGELLACDGSCLRCFHQSCLPAECRPPPDEDENTPWFCPDCREGNGQCCVCKQVGKAGSAVFKCRMGCCGLSYHPACLGGLTGYKFVLHKGSLDTARSARDPPNFTCPVHYCASCHVSGDAIKMLRCWNCPTAYHSKCIPHDVMRYNQRNIQCFDCTAKKAHTRPTTPVGIATLPSSESADSTWNLAGPLAPDPPAPRVALHPPPPGPSSSQSHGAKRAKTSHGHPPEAPTTPRTSRFFPGAEAAPLSSRPSQAGGVSDEGKPQSLINSLTRVSTGETKLLTGKAAFHFGGHAKGGSCDFMVPVTNIKFHSKLHVQASGNVTLEYCFKRAGQQAPIQIIRPMHNEDGETGGPCEFELPLDRQELLHSGDSLVVCGQTFLFQAGLASESISREVPAQAAV